MALYSTNDKEGRYFQDRFIVELCTPEEEYYTEYFPDLQSMYEWLEDISDMQVQSMQDVDAIVRQWQKNTQMPTAISTSTKLTIDFFQRHNIYV